MKKNISLIKIITLILLVSLLVGCGQLNKAVNNPDDTREVEETTTETETGTETESDDFTVSLMYAGEAYIPKTDISVRWSDGKSVHEAPFGDDGIARVSGLDGDYQVTLTSLPKNYTYNPNVYVATNDSKHVIIELFKYKSSKRGGESEYKCITADGLGVYRCELKDENQKVFYEFSPRQSGTYTIESWVDITANIVNPLYDAYNGTHAAKYFDRTVDDGGVASTYTKNFKFTIEVDERMIGNTYTFAIKAMSNSSNFPVTVDFALQLDGGFEYEWGSSDIIVPKEYDKINWAEINALRGDKNTLVGPEKTVDGTKVFDTEDWGYDENLGCYRKKNNKTGELDGPVLYAYISAPSRFLDESFTNIEYRGNKALTVSNGTENYKLFIEGYSALIEDPPSPDIGPYFCVLTCPCRVLGTQSHYGACPPGCTECSSDCRPCPEEGLGMPGYGSKCNEHGVVPVTQELKDFLQKYSVSQRLFNDGNGWVETSSHIYATEEDQWLFACAFYQ